MIKENIFMSHSNGKSWLAWLLVPLVVYGSQLAFWANKMDAGVWPQEWHQWWKHIIACGFSLLVMGVSLRLGLIYGKTLALWIAISVLVVSAIVLLDGGYYWGDGTTINVEVRLLCLLTFAFPTAYTLWTAVLRTKK